jgi:hypothetical protein
LAVSFLPVENDTGMLLCKFCTGEPVIHEFVPERLYRILVKSPFAGSYYRKHIKPKFPYLPGSAPPKFKEDKSAIKAKAKLLAAQRLAASAPRKGQGWLF